ncbi:MAG: hypothetical protein ACKVQB_06775 [Bacteroidia bacterium]
MAFAYELGNARYRYIDIKIATGIKYKNLMFNIGIGVGKNYNRVFIEGSSKDKMSTAHRNNYNKSIIMPIDLEIGLSKSCIDITLIGQTIWGELFPKMTPYHEKVFYNYPYNLGVKFTYWIKK